MPLFKEVEKKNRLLRSVAGSGVEQLNELVARWDKYKDMMESHQENIKDQVMEGEGEGERLRGRKRGRKRYMYMYMYCTCN